MWQELKGETNNAANEQFHEKRQLSQSSTDDGRSTADVPHGGTECAAGAMSTSEELCEACARYTAQLLEGETSAMRQTAASELRRHVMGARADMVIEEKTHSLLVPPLARALDDQSERVREHSLAALHTLVQKADASSAATVLQYALPVLQRRLLRQEGSTAPLEPSEEIRASMHSFIRTLVHAADKKCAYAASEIVELLEEGHFDSFHSVVIETCHTAKALARALGRRLQPVGRQLVRMHAPSLGHRRARVRAEAVDAVRCVAHCGGHDAILDLVGFRHPNVVPIKAFYEGDQRVNFFGKLASDSSTRVRERFAATLEDWITNLPERKEHESRFVPFALAVLADSAPEVSNRAFAALDALGREREESERPDELRQRLVNDPQRSLPPLELTPLQHRPRLGTRVAVQENLTAVIPASLSELTSWQSETRAASAQLLHVALSLAEESATQHVPQLVPTLVSVAFGKSVESDVSENALACLKILSASVLATQWIETVQTLLDSGGELEQQRALHAAAVMSQYAYPVTELKKIISMICEREEICESVNDGVQCAAIEALKSAMERLLNASVVENDLVQDIGIYNSAICCLKACTTHPCNNSQIALCSEAMRNAAHLTYLQMSGKSHVNDSEPHELEFIQLVCLMLIERMLSRLDAGDFTAMDADRIAQLPHVASRCAGKKVFAGEHLGNICRLAVETWKRNKADNVLTTTLLFAIYHAFDNAIENAHFQHNVQGLEELLLHWMHLHAARQTLIKATAFGALSSEGLVHALEQPDVLSCDFSLESDGEARLEAANALHCIIAYARGALMLRKNPSNLPLQEIWRLLQQLEDDPREDVREQCSNIREMLA